MLLLQFSTSHYCLKARLALGYKQINYQVENLTPARHLLRVKPLSGDTTVPVLLPQQKNCPAVVSDSTEILRFLDMYQPLPPLSFQESLGESDADSAYQSAYQKEAWRLEEYFDEIGIATRLVYTQFRATDGKYVDPSWQSMAVIRLIRLRYGINAQSAEVATQKIANAIAFLSEFWQDSHHYLVGDRFSVADLTAAALLTPLANIPTYRQNYPWLFERIAEIHSLCNEPLPQNW